MSKNIKIRLAYEEDIEGIVRLLGSVFGDQFGLLYHKRYSWFFNNPYLSKNDSAIWVATNDGRIVGHLIVCPVDFTVNGATVHGYFDADLAVDPSCRRMGIARKIYESALDKCHFILSASSTDIGGGLEESLGFFNFLNVPRSFKVLRPEEYIPKVFSWFPGARLPVNWYYRDHSVKRSFSGISNFNPKRDLQSLSRFCDKILRQYDIAMYRGPQFFSWRYLDIPLWTYRILVARDNDSMRGYLVYRVFERNKRKVGRICDFVVAEKTPEWLDKLLAFAVNELRETGCTAVETYCETLPSLRNVFHRQGFREQRKTAIDFRIYAHDASIMAQIRNSNVSWFLTCGDVDLDLT